MKNDLLTTRQIANRLGVTVQTIRRWTRERKIPHLRVGPKVVRFKWEDVKASMLVKAVMK